MSHRRTPTTTPVRSSSRCKAKFNTKPTACAIRNEFILTFTTPRWLRACSARRLRSEIQHLARVRIAQPAKGISRVVLETTGASDFSVSLKSNPFRLVVAIREAGQRERGDALADLPKNTAAVAQPTGPGLEARTSRRYECRSSGSSSMLDMVAGTWEQSAARV